jgi:hypothetical protein
MEAKPASATTSPVAGLVTAPERPEVAATNFPSIQCKTAEAVNVSAALIAPPVSAGNTVQSMVFDFQCSFSAAQEICFHESRIVSARDLQCAEASRKARQAIDRKENAASREAATSLMKIPLL